MQKVTAKAPADAALRADRDRFVALAFCWADLLLELDADAKVAFAGGATLPLLGRKQEDVIGVSVADLIAEADRSLMTELLGIARKHGRIEDVDIRLQGRAGPTAPLMLAGYALDELKGHFFLAFRLIEKTRRKGIDNDLKRDGDSGLYDARAFADVVQQSLVSGDGPEDSQMTLISLGDYDGLLDRIGEDGEKDLMNTVGACLRANSVDGDTASRIEDDRYGLLHDSSVDVAQLEIQIAQFAKEVDPTGQGATVETATVEVDKTDISGEDLANGLIYTINRFKNAKTDDAFSMASLSSSLSSLVSQATASVSSFKKLVATSSFEIAFQPIIDLRTNKIHHYEALVRFNADDHNESPYENITFAEETGLIAEFDLAMVKKVVEWLAGVPSRYRVAVNISGHSVSDKTYTKELHTLLRDNQWVRDRVMFEITESARMDDLAAANRFIQGLRQEGYEVCLDDFGAGAANFQYLSTLEIDVVKLDGSAVHNARKGKKGKAFLKALTNLCHELDVGTIAEMIDDDEGLEFVRSCGVQYVQGYLFGKPSTDIYSFRKLEKK